MFHLLFPANTRSKANENIQPIPFIATLYGPIRYTPVPRAQDVYFRFQKETVI